MSNCEVVEDYSNTIKSLDWHCNKSTIIPKIDNSLPEHHSLKDQNSKSWIELYSPLRNQWDQNYQQNEHYLDSIKPWLNNKKLILHIDFKSIKELINLIRFKFPFINIVSEGKRSELNVEGIISDTSWWENEPDIDRPRYEHSYFDN